VTKFKAVILDIDGTLVKSGLDYLPTQKVKDSIKRIQKLVSVSVATGRPLSLCKHVVETLNIDKPSVFNGGASIQNPVEEKPIVEYSITNEAKAKIIEITSRFGVRAIVSGSEYWSAEEKKQRKNLPVQQMIVLNLTTEQTFAVLDELNAVEGIIGHATSTWSKDADHDIHITSIDATKYHAVTELLEILNVKKDEVLAIGDNHNDLPLFEAVGFKIAMGDAPDELKKAADFVAPPLEEDGAAVALDKFII